MLRAAFITRPRSYVVLPPRPAETYEQLLEFERASQAVVAWEKILNLLELRGPPLRLLPAGLPPGLYAAYSGPAWLGVLRHRQYLLLLTGGDSTGVKDRLLSSARRLARRAE